MRGLPTWCLLVVVGLSPSAGAEGWASLSSPPPKLGGGEKDGALVIGIEDYAFVSKVTGAAENARAWYGYLTKTLGVPASRAKLLLDVDATLEAIRREAREKASMIPPGGTSWVVFIGHGAPAQDGKDGVLVGVDAQQSAESLYARGLRLRDLLDAATHGKQARTIVVVDACFSGRTSTGSALAEGLQPLIPLAPAAVVGGKSTLILTAGTSKQFAGPLPGLSVPAFSYLLLGGLRGWADLDEDGVVTAKEAIAYANDALAATLKGRQQTPEVSPLESGSVGLVSFGKVARERGPDLADVALWLSRSTGSKAPPPSDAPCPGGRVFGRTCVGPEHEHLADCACLPWTSLTFTMQRDGKPLCTSGRDCVKAAPLVDGQCTTTGTGGTTNDEPWCYVSEKCPAAMGGQNPWILCQPCPVGTSVVNGVCVSSEVAAKCACRHWVDLDFSVKKGDAVVCSGRGGCAAKLGLSGNSCADVYGDRVPYCYVGDECPVASKGQYPYIGCVLQR